MEIHLKKWGNSLGLRIPHQLAASLGFDETVTLELLEGDRALVLRKKYVPPHCWRAFLMGFNMPTMWPTLWAVLPSDKS